VQVRGMSIEPFTPVQRDGRLHGRGAVDDKGCLVAFMLALRELAREPDGLDITFVAAVDEEVHQTGVLHHLKQRLHYDGGIAGEPTELRIVSASKGCVRFDIEVLGRAAHSSRPETGIDAVTIGAELALHLKRRFAPLLSQRSHALVGSATMVCTKIEGGEGLNTVPARCVLKFDRRTIPGEINREVWQEIAAEASAFGRGIPDGASITMQPPFADCPAMQTDQESAIVTAARAACRAEGLPDTVLGVPYGSDASRMADAGIPTIILGPGSIEQAHTADEFVEIAEVTRASHLLCTIARRFAVG
jgi:succinyl-diaminopimelate desuccinylase